MVELLTVMTLIALLLGWFGNALVSVWQDYRMRLAMEQAYADAALLEVVRRGADPGLLPSNNRTKTQMLGNGAFSAFYPIIARLSVLGVIDGAQVGDTEFTLNSERSQVWLELALNELVRYQFPAAETNAYQVSSSDPAEYRLEVTVYHRERDPLLMNYVAESLTYKNL